MSNGGHAQKAGRLGGGARSIMGAQASVDAHFREVSGGRDTGTDMVRLPCFKNTTIFLLLFRRCACCHLP